MKIQFDNIQEKEAFIDVLKQSGISNDTDVFAENPLTVIDVPYNIQKTLHVMQGIVFSVNSVFTTIKYGDEIFAFCSEFDLFPEIKVILIPIHKYVYTYVYDKTLTIPHKTLKNIANHVFRIIQTPNIVMSEGQLRTLLFMLQTAYKDVLSKDVDISKGMKGIDSRVEEHNKESKRLHDSMVNHSDIYVPLIKSLTSELNTDYGVLEEYIRFNGPVTINSLILPLLPLHVLHTLDKNKYFDFTLVNPDSIIVRPLFERKSSVLIRVDSLSCRYEVIPADPTVDKNIWECTAYLSLLTVLVDNSSLDISIERVYKYLAEYMVLSSVLKKDITMADISKVFFSNPTESQNNKIEVSRGTEEDAWNEYQKAAFSLLERWLPEERKYPAYMTEIQAYSTGKEAEQCFSKLEESLLVSDTKFCTRYAMAGGGLLGFACVFNNCPDLKCAILFNSHTAVLYSLSGKSFGDTDSTVLLDLLMDHCLHDNEFSAEALDNFILSHNQGFKDSEDDKFTRYSKGKATLAWSEAGVSIKDLLESVEGNAEATKQVQEIFKLLQGLDKVL